MDAIKDIFKDLCVSDLLKRCVGWYTQDENVSLNSLIWNFCPKNISFGENIVQIAVNESVISYNDLLQLCVTVS